MLRVAEAAAVQPRVKWHALCAQQSDRCARVSRMRQHITNYFHCFMKPILMISYDHLISYLTKD